MEAFEIVIRRMKLQGGICLKLAEAADAAFLLWQLAEDNRKRAQQTISEHLPLLIDVVCRDNDEGR